MVISVETVEPKSEREIIVARTFDAPARLVFQVWTTPALRDAALASGSYDGMSETFGQLDEVLVTLRA
jgi:hypothetical protein